MSIRYSIIVFFVALLMVTNSFSQSNNIEESNSNIATPIPLAMGYGELGYELPEIGSYELPSIGDAANGKVLDEKGVSQSLHELYKGKYNLLSFMYSNCSDVNGCPLSSNVFYKLKSAMRTDPVLAKDLRLLTLSFDPERDTPEVMRLYGANFKYSGNKGEWGFLTASSIDALNPILKAYNQDIQRNLSVNGKETGDISHILRIFLIDPELRIRNIYSVSFLHADLITNDVKTLLAASSQKSASKKEVLFSKPIVSLLSKPGDNKDGYENKNYTTQSKSLLQRNGKAADLLSIVQHPPLGLPPLSDSVLNNISKDKISLGRKLFYDRRLSLNDTFSCAMCHVAEQGFTHNEMLMAVGIEGRSVRRNSPTIYNIAYATKLFHDGREDSLEQQVWGPLLAKNEMNNPSIGYVINKIKRIPGYEDHFKKAFAGEGINMLTVGQALASYQRTLLSADSAFDRWFYGKQDTALNTSAIRGFKLFNSKAKCSSCHSVNKEHALFTDNQMHNTGIGYRETMGVTSGVERVALAPGIFVDVDMKAIDRISEPVPADLGLYEITENPDDRWKYRTPTLRNVQLTAPYMHNGSLATLQSVVNFYNKGGIKNEVLDPLITPLDLSAGEEKDLVAFLESLTGSNVDTLVADAFAAPVGDTMKQGEFE